MSRTNYRRAVGLSYQAEANGSPAVAVQGDEILADEIVRIANRYGVPVIEQPELAKSLAELEIDQEIPRALFRPVAIILARLKNFATARTR